MTLDADEYLHLAVHAAKTREPHACLGYLKEVLRMQPDHAQALHLLASQHASLGLTARAIEGLEHALRADPALELARLQLAMLLLDAQRPAEARAQFAALAGARDAALRHYAAAVPALLDGRIDAGREHVAQGASLREGNEALAALMERLAARFASAAVPRGPDRGEDVFLGAYGPRPGRGG